MNREKYIIGESREEAVCARLYAEGRGIESDSSSSRIHVRVDSRQQRYDVDI